MSASALGRKRIERPRAQPTPSVGSDHRHERPRRAEHGVPGYFFPSRFFSCPTAVGIPFCLVIALNRSFSFAGICRR